MLFGKLISIKKAISKKIKSVISKIFAEMTNLN